VFQIHVAGPETAVKQDSSEKHRSENHGSGKDSPKKHSSKNRHKNKGVAQLVADWYRWQETHYPDFGFGVGLVDCRLGQKGNIWFLGGTGGDAPAERTCLKRIPAGKQFFFPLVNLVVWDEPLNTAERRQLLDDIFSDQVPGEPAAEACRLSATLDGTPMIFDGIPIERVQSPTFTYLGDKKALADGFWVLSPKLKRGKHTLSFSGGLCSFGSNTSFFDVDVTYNFTVR
jgi:hypothetical protein